MKVAKMVVIDVDKDRVITDVVTASPGTAWKCSGCGTFTDLIFVHKDDEGNILKDECQYCFNESHPQAIAAREREEAAYLKYLG